MDFPPVPMYTGYEKYCAIVIIVLIGVGYLVFRIFMSSARGNRVERALATSRDVADLQHRAEYMADHVPAAKIGEWLGQHDARAATAPEPGSQEHLAELARIRPDLSDHDLRRQIRVAKQRQTDVVTVRLAWHIAAERIRTD